MYATRLRQRFAFAEEQRLDCGQEALLAVRRRGFANRASVVSPSRCRIALGVSRSRSPISGMVVTERLAPVGHREVGIEFLSRLELRARACFHPKLCRIVTPRRKRSWAGPVAEVGK